MSAEITKLADRLAVLIIGIILCLVLWGMKTQTDNLENKLKLTASKLEDLKRTHEESEKTLQEAIKARDSINAQCEQKRRELDDVLRKNADFSDIFIPDDVRDRMLNGKKGSGASLLPSTGNAPR